MSDELSADADRLEAALDRIARATPQASRIPLPDETRRALQSRLEQLITELRSVLGPGA